MEHYRYSPALIDSDDNSVLVSKTYMPMPDDVENFSIEETFLVDLSLLTKQLIIGDGASTLLKEQGIATLPEPYQYLELDDAGFIACLSKNEYLYSQGLTAEQILTPGKTEQEDVLILNYDCFDIAFGGKHIDDILEQSTKLNYQSFPENSWMPTQFAKAEIWLKQVDTQPHHHFRFCTSPANGAYLFEYMLKQIRTLNGYLISTDNYQLVLQERQRQ